MGTSKTGFLNARFPEVFFVGSWPEGLDKTFVKPWEPEFQLVIDNLTEEERAQYNKYLVQISEMFGSGGP